LSIKHKRYSADIFHFSIIPRYSILIKQAQFWGWSMVWPDFI